MPVAVHPAQLCTLILAANQEDALRARCCPKQKERGGFFEKAYAETSSPLGLFSHQKDQRIFGKIVHAA
jgi:hypothetical protein